MTNRGGAAGAVGEPWPLFRLGVVYGDIGTSPLYAFKESLGAAGFQPATHRQC